MRLLTIALIAMFALSGCAKWYINDEIKKQGAEEFCGFYLDVLHAVEDFKTENDVLYFIHSTNIDNATAFCKKESEEYNPLRFCSKYKVAKMREVDFDAMKSAEQKFFITTNVMYERQCSI